MASAPYLYFLHAAERDPEMPSPIRLTVCQPHSHSHSIIASATAARLSRTNRLQWIWLCQ